jgi:hypothetical protein
MVRLACSPLDDQSGADSVTVLDRGYGFNHNASIRTSGESFATISSATSVWLRTHSVRLATGAGSNRLLQLSLAL